MFPFPVEISHIAKDRFSQQNVQEIGEQILSQRLIGQFTSGLA